jgi:hypothetical protein
MARPGFCRHKEVLADGGDVLAYAGSLLAPGLVGRILPLAGSPPELMMLVMTVKNDELAR